MKILCICHGGRVRSVALRYILTDHLGFTDTLAAGLTKNSPETISILCEWADTIFLLVDDKPDFLEAHQDKIRYLDIGPDIWGSPNDIGLIQKLKQLLFNSQWYAEYVIPKLHAEIQKGHQELEAHNKEMRS